MNINSQSNLFTLCELMSCFICDKKTPQHHIDFVWPIDVFAFYIKLHHHFVCVWSQHIDGLGLEKIKRLYSFQFKRKFFQ